MPDRFNRSRNSNQPQNSPVRYPSDASLRRPLDMPIMQRRFSYVFVAIAVVIAIIMLINAQGCIYGDQKTKAEAVQQAINRGVTLDVPRFDEFISLDNEDIQIDLADKGYTVYDYSGAEEEQNGGIDLIKLPSDVSLAEGGALFSRGVGNLDSAQAAKLLSGSWRLRVSRAENLEMRLRYADFAATDATTAIADAMETQGWDAASASPATQDSSGNTNVTGAVDLDGDAYNWTISVCKLTDVYNVTGFPASAQFTGIRIVKA